MVATVKIYKDFGGSDTSPGTSHDTTSDSPNVRLKTADDATIDTNNPCVVPASSFNYSFWNSLYAKLSVAPSVQVNNLKIYTDAASFGTGITTYIGDQYPTKNHSSSSGYKVATGTAGTTGTELITGYTGITTKTDIFTYTSGSPVSLSISESGGLMVNVGDTSNYFVVQAKLGTTATPGAKSASTWTLQYDEI